MRGLELAEAYYNTYGQRMIESHYPELKSRIAAGLVGMGSDCFGFDDDISKDHDWGPGFCLWLEEKDYHNFGLQLQNSYNALPKTFKGYSRRTSALGGDRVGVMEIWSFYSYFIGLREMPNTLIKWLVVPEENFAACTNGKVFYDPLGKFSEIRQGLKNYYPEDVRLKKIAARCMAAAQSGQYNYSRCLRRAERYAAHCALTKFCEAVFSLVYLLNKQYCPYYKWSQKNAEQLPIMGADVAKKIDLLVQELDLRKNVALIEELCSGIISTMKNQGISDGNSDFLLDHGPIVQARIKDEQLRNMDVWYAGG